MAADTVVPQMTSDGNDARIAEIRDRPCYRSSLKGLATRYANMQASHAMDAMLMQQELVDEASALFEDAVEDGFLEDFLADLKQRASEDGLVVEWCFGALIGRYGLLNRYFPENFYWDDAELHSMCLSGNSEKFRRFKANSEVSNAAQACGLLATKLNYMRHVDVEDSPSAMKPSNADEPTHTQLDSQGHDFQRQRCGQDIGNRVPLRPMAPEQVSKSEPVGRSGESLVDSNDVRKKDQLTTEELMRRTLVGNPASREWSIRQWEQNISRTISTIAETPTWKALVAAREGVKLGTLASRAAAEHKRLGQSRKRTPSRPDYDD